MKARLVTRSRAYHRQDLFSEIVIWVLPRSMPGSTHNLKYRLALIDAGVCVLRYDNETGKGDHRHIGPTEARYSFTTIDTLLDDFQADIRRYCDGHPDHR